MKAIRVDHTETVLNTGKVLVTGGNWGTPSGSAQVINAELYTSAP